MTTVARDHHVAVPEPNPSVRSRSQVRIAGIAGEPLEGPWEREPVSFGDSPSQPYVSARTFGLSIRRRRSSEGVESIDSLFGDAHSGTLRVSPHWCCVPLRRVRYHFDSCRLRFPVDSLPVPLRRVRYDTYWLLYVFRSETSRCARGGSAIRSDRECTPKVVGRPRLEDGGGRSTETSGRFSLSLGRTDRRWSHYCRAVECALRLGDDERRAA